MLKYVNINYIKRVFYRVIIMCEKFAGMNINELFKVREKLNIAGVELSDIHEFLDRDNVQLFAEMKNNIRQLERKLDEVRKICG